MKYVYKVSTININGMSSTTRIRMLEDFLHKQDIDIALLQEVSNPKIKALQRYTVHGLPINNIKRLPSGR
jgi:exonuclease III